MFRLTAFLTILAPFVATTSAVTIDTVPVGNPGNAPDSRYETRDYGVVDYRYNIGKYEVTAGQYCEFLNAVDPYGTNADGLYGSSMDSSSYGCQITWNSSLSTYDFSGRPSGTEADWADRPVNYISWYNAAMFANWATSGNIHRGAYDTSSGANWGAKDARDYTGITAHDSAAMDNLVSIYGRVYVIPTEDEWYKAAYHKNDGVTGNYFSFPTGSNTEPGYVNDSGNLGGTGTPFTDGVSDPGNYATYNGDREMHGIGSPYYRTEVGEWENSDSPYGTFDQGGNVWEWNEAIFRTMRKLRGASFTMGNVDSLHASYSVGTSPTNRLKGSGFRVVSIPEPSPLVLLFIGTFGLFAYTLRQKTQRSK